MLVSDLLSYDIVPSELAALRSAIPERLLPLQELAVRRGLLGQADLFIVGPPGSGKSALVELLTLHAEHVGTAAIVVRPDPGLATLRRLLSGDSAAELNGADLIIIDELEALRGTESEALLQQLLSRIQLLKERREGGPRLCLFSAPLEGIAQLSSRLRTTLITKALPESPDKRQLGTLCDGRANFAPLHDSAQRRSLDLCLPSRAQLFEMLLELGRRGPTLILSPDEASCVRLFCRLSAGANGAFPAATRALEALSETTPGRAQALLSESLPQGIALYGPSLSPRQQDLVEAGLRNGEIRLLVAPLGEALRLERLSAAWQSVVVHTRWRWQRDGQTGRLVQVPLDQLELLRLSRLGGVGQGDGMRGPLLVYARSPRESEEIWQQQIDAPPRPLGVSQAAERRDSAELVWRRWAESNREAAEKLSPLELLCVTALGPSALPMPLLLSEQPGADYGARLAQRVAALNLEARPLFRGLRSTFGPLDHETLRAVKRGLLLGDWLDGTPAATIEDTYHVWIGLVQRLATDGADRLDALCRVCAAAGWSETARQPLMDLARRLRSRSVDRNSDGNGDATSAVVAPLRALRSGRSVSTLVGALRAKKAAEKAAEKAAGHALASAEPAPVLQITRERRR